MCKVPSSSSTWTNYPFCCLSPTSTTDCANGFPGTFCPDFLEHSALVAPSRASTGIQTSIGVTCLAACLRASVLMKIPIVMHSQEEASVKLLWEPLCD